MASRDDQDYDELDRAQQALARFERGNRIDARLHDKRSEVVQELGVTDPNAIDIEANRRIAADFERADPQLAAEWQQLHERVDAAFEQIHRHDAERDRDRDAEMDIGW